MQTITLAGGCFWGAEELFGSQTGVVDTEVGYTGGQNDRPTYQFHPGHAEALQISFDPEIISEDELYDYFFRIHDPTTVNRQGNDVGSSYRSAIFYENSQQKLTAESAIKRNQAHWSGSIVTTLEPLTNFWPAEDEHQDYLQKNPGGYTCHYERW